MKAQRLSREREARIRVSRSPGQMMSAGTGRTWSRQRG